MTVLHLFDCSTWTNDEPIYQRLDAELKKKLNEDVRYKEWMLWIMWLRMMAYWTKTSHELYCKRGLVVTLAYRVSFYSLLWRQNERYDVWNHRHFDCLLCRLFRHIKKYIKTLRHWPFWCPSPEPVARKLFPFDDIMQFSIINTEKTLQHSWLRIYVIQWFFWVHSE